MPPVFDAASIGVIAASPSLTFSHTCTGTDRVLVVSVGTWHATTNPAPTVTATYGGVAMSQIDTHPFSFASSFARLTMLQLVAPATGANNIVVTASADSEIAVSAVSYTAARQTTPFDTASKTNTTTTAGRPSQVISSAAGDLVIDALLGFDMGTITAGTGQTKRAENANGNGANTTVMSEEAGGASITMSWGWTNSLEFAGHMAVNLHAAAVLSVEQEGFRWRNDDGSETTATWKAAQDTNVSIAPDETARLRMIVNATSDPPNEQYKLQYRKVGDASWRDIDTPG